MSARVEPTPRWVLPRGPVGKWSSYLAVGSEDEFGEVSPPVRISSLPDVRPLPPPFSAPCFARLSLRTRGVPLRAQPTISGRTPQVARHAHARRRGHTA